MSEIVVKVSGLAEVKEIARKVRDWAAGGYQITLTNAARSVAERVKNDIRDGKETETRALAPLRPSTLEGPVRRDGNPTPRSYYGNKPLIASGALVNDIVGRKVKDNEYEVTAFSPEGQMKLSSNAKTVHSGSPFAGDTPKVTRDPLQVSEARMDIIENAILADLEKAIGI